MSAQLRSRALQEGRVKGNAEQVPAMAEGPIRAGCKAQTAAVAAATARICNAADCPKRLLRRVGTCSALPKALRHMKQPMTLVLDMSPGARDPVARALCRRGLRGAGQHIQSRGAQRRADRVALQALLRRKEWDE